MSWLARVIVVSVVAEASLGIVRAQAPPQRPSTRQVAWAVGDRLTLAAVLYDSGAAADQVAARLADARTIALSFGVDVPPLPAKTGEKSEDSASILLFVLRTAGPPIQKALEEKYGAPHARLFELATRSGLLLMLYVPGDSTGATIADVIDRDGPLAHLPEPLWKPVSGM